MSSALQFRQLIGRLECLPGRGYEIRYDLLDGASLRTREAGEDFEPFVPAPFPLHPPAPDMERGGVEKRLRPHLFWAAMHLAAPDDAGNQQAVLISITQSIGGYAEDLLSLVERTWELEPLPRFFVPPTEPEKVQIWQTCLRSCEDYFRTDSREYQLLLRGIVVHHGSMPGLMSRLLVRLIDERIVHLVLATSTLSEGVNLPFETVLIPTLRRANRTLDVREFGNLIGRAGRPGVSTEGRCLVLLAAGVSNTARVTYDGLVRDLTDGNQIELAAIASRSPLAELLAQLETKWRMLTGDHTPEGFHSWLEQTAPLEFGDDLATDTAGTIETLDALDGILLAAIVEIEQLAEQELDPDEIEQRLQYYWQRSYGRFASDEQERLGSLFVRRGRALTTRVYPLPLPRRRLYRTSLAPRSGNRLINMHASVKRELSLGHEYARWNTEQRFDYIAAIVRRIGSLPKFRPSEKIGNSSVRWEDVLQWWLAPSTAQVVPNFRRISEWHRYVSQTFGYQFNWGLGSVISLAIDDVNAGNMLTSSVDDWPRTGLPWIAFWIKELIVWGTLEPVAAYLLARGVEITRADAERAAVDYYREQPSDTGSDELLNAVMIRTWADARPGRDETVSPLAPPGQMDVELLRDFTRGRKHVWQVVPVEEGFDIKWFDIAGFPLAKCRRPAGWRADYLHTHDFVLDTLGRVVTAQYYL